MKLHTSLQVAQYLIDKAAEDKNTLTPMQLLKLVYMCHGWMLGIHSRPLIKDRVEAWRYGPVIPDLYHSIKHYRDKPVQKLGGFWNKAKFDADEFDPDEKSIMDQVYDLYGKYTGIQLSALTHQSGTPWDVSYNESERNISISDDIIQNYYWGLANGNAEESTATAAIDG